MEEIKNKITNEANVLLICGDDYIIDQVKQYGFKNLTIIKSIVVADNYFTSHPEELDNYDIILSSVKRYGTTYDKLWLEKQLESVDRNNLYITIYPRYEEDFAGPKPKCTAQNEPYYNINTWSYAMWVSPSLNGGTIEEILNHVSKIAYNKLDNQKKECKPIELPNKDLPLPNKKSDLKILVGEWHKSIDYSKVAERLGLNIDFMDENNYSMGKIYNKLGDYDVIIGSNTYLNGLRFLNGESTEQCKLSGRKLVILANYRDNIWKSFGKEIVISSVEAGKLATDYETKSITIDFLSEYPNPAEAFSTMIEAVVNLYNEALAAANEKAIEDLDFRTLDDINKPYNDYIEEQLAKEEAIKDIHNEMVNVALSASEEILKREVDKEDNTRLAEDFINRLN